MIRSFIALPLPVRIAADLEALRAPVPEARWVAPQNLHLTLAFLGEQHPHALEDADLALSAIRAPVLELRLEGVGLFGGDKPTALYAALAENPDLRRLQAKVERALRQAGVKFESRNFTPHVTVAWLGRKAPRHRLISWLEGFALHRSPAFAVEEFALYRSEMGTGGSVYEAMREYPLGESALASGSAEEN
ncbi:RNA 2',3'-cyclic phosphodiesterase [Neomegalonema sp.]|uniref:RNA 2',3'-cyclic phosphodiesterase n=1 Tax=Neomegalonema sp. TaxID=2039713 RepID=UPI00260D11CA|nr:RNA 2',3'-cyclic phosphodiesterase [Neomegalonema sp.]MDD2867667.1 RNA 2',3'-cyclic phosphodiesterase [Neomegalonema sp.]